MFNCDTEMAENDDQERYSVDKYFVEAKIEVDDSFAVLARRNVDYFREKFDQLLRMQ